MTEDFNDEKLNEVLNFYIDLTIDKLDKIFRSVPQPSCLIKKWEKEIEELRTR